MDRKQKVAAALVTTTLWCPTCDNAQKVVIHATRTRGPASMRCVFTCLGCKQGHVVSYKKAETR